MTWHGESKYLLDVEESYGIGPLTEKQVRASQTVHHVLGIDALIIGKTQYGCIATLYIYQ